VTINVDNLKALFKEVINQAWNILTKDLLLNINKSNYQFINLKEFSKFEDKNNYIPFKCFRDFHPNADKNNNFIQDYILLNEILFKQFFNISSEDNNKMFLNKSKLNSYLKSVELFKKRCLLLIYLTTGAPLYNTKVLTLKFLNSFKDQKKLYLDISNNLFILNISYHKAQNSSDLKALNIRYLCKSVSEIFLLFIVLVDPFINFLNIASNNIKNLDKNKSLLSYFFYYNNKLLSSKNIS
jgi:hypothetical protein